jgi:hypothetical protein
MAANKRVFYAIHKAGVAPIGSTTYQTIHGLQSIGITTTFNLEQVFELGQLAVYENIEGIPDVEVTTEKLLDGYCPVYLLTTQSDESGVAPPTATLVGRSNSQCIIGMGIYPDEQSSSSGVPVSEVHMSGLFISSFGYEVSVDGNAMESATLVGNNKIWVGTNGETNGTFDDGTHWDGTSSITDNTDQPYSISTSGGVNRREDILFGSGVLNSWLPGDIPGLSLSGGKYWNTLSGGEYGAHFQRVGVSVDLGREDMFELGQRAAYHKYVNFPVEVTSEYGIISVSGDMVSALENGLSNGLNLTDRSAKIFMREGLQIDLGERNKLSSVGMSGGDTGGGNQEISYTYTNFNDCTVQHPQDVVVALRP